MTKGALAGGWADQLKDELEAPYMRSLRAFLVKQKREGKVVYPPSRLMFNAMHLCPFEATRVVIIGQDPYHGAGQAHGLSFSVPQGVPQPPSLVNILQEINQDLGAPERRIPKTAGCLEGWARQGVLLLNAVLSVEHGRAGSHQGQGWERFTDAIVERLNRERSGLVFLLWGAYAQKKGSIVDTDRHRVLKAPHPSPLSAHRGFFGCRHFSQTNAFLEGAGGSPMDWFAVE